MLQALGIGGDGASQVGIEVDLERQLPRVGLVPERPRDHVNEIGKHDLFGVDRHGPGLDLGQIEDVADQVQEVGAGAVDGAGEVDLLGREVAVRIVAELLAQNEDAVERGTQLVRHVGEEFRLVFRGQRELGGLLLERAARLLDFLVLALHLDVALGQLLGLLLELLIGLLQLALLRLQFAGELLRLLEQPLGLHRRLDAVDDDADIGGELIEEHDLRRGEFAQRRELDYRLDLVLEQHRQHHDVARYRLEQRRSDGDGVRGHLADQNAALVRSALSDQSLAERKMHRMPVEPVVGVAREQVQGRHVFAGRLVDDAELRVHQRRELAEQQPADGAEVALALQHVGELGEVGLEPILLGVAVGGEPQVIDHGVDVVFELGHLAARIDRDRSGQVPLGDGGRDLGDRAHLRGQIGRQQVDVAGEVLPGAGGAGHVGLTAEAAFHADLARDAGDLVGEDRESVGHVVDGFGERRHLALRLHREILLEVAVGDCGHHLHDAAHLLGQVGRHHVDGVGQVLPGAGDARHSGLAAELALSADLARDAGDFRGERVELVHHGVDGVLQLQDFALYVDGDLAGKVAARDRRGHLGDVAHLRGEVRRQQVDVVGEVFPGAGGAGHDGLTAEASVRADLARHARHFGGEGAQLLGRGVERVLEQQELAAHVHGDLLGEVAAGDRGGDLGDVADLRGQVRRHRVDVVGEVLPGAGDLRHLRLAAELAFGADLARDARHFRGERVELVHHGVDGVLELQDFALHIDGDLAGQVAARDRCGHLGDVADLRGEVARHRVDAVGEVLPGAGDAGHVGLAAETAFGADLAGDARHLAGETVELVHHGVERFLQLKDFAAHVHGDLAGEVAAGNGSGDLGDVADLAGQVAGHRVDAVGQVLPGAGDAGHLGLAAEFAFGADLAGDARHLGRERVELVHHCIERFLQLQDFAAHIDGDLLRQVALRHGGRHLGDIADLAGEVRRHRVDAVGEVLPGAGDAAHHGLAAELALGADLAGDARHLAGKRVELVHHRVDGVLELEDFAAHVDGDLLRQVAAGDGGGHLGDVADLRGQVRCKPLFASGEVLPGAGDAAHVGLAAEPAFGADLAGDARHFAGEGVELVDHRVDGLLELQDLAAHVHRDLLGEIAAGDGGGNVCNVADLCGEVRRHEVDVVGQVLPGAGDARHLRLAAELAFGADFPGDTGHLAGEAVELVDHRVDGVLELEDFAAHLHADLARKIGACHGGRHLRDVAHLVGEVAAHGVHRVRQILPGAGDAGHDRLATELAVGADLAGNARHFRGERAQLIDHRVDGFLELQDLATHVDRDLLREVAIGDRDRHLGQVPNLPGEIGRHRVDAVGQVLPDAGHLAHLRLAAELALGADLARDARHLRGEHAELLDHRVDDGGGAQELAFERPPVDVEAHRLQQVALREGGDRAGDLRGWPQQIVNQRVDGDFHLAPGAVRQAELHPLAGLAFATHDMADALELLRHALVGGDDLVEGVGNLAEDPDLVARHADGEVAHAHGLQRIQQIVQLGHGTAVETAVGIFSGGRVRRGAVGLDTGLELANRFTARLHGNLQGNPQVG